MSDSKSWKESKIGKIVLMFFEPLGYIINHPVSIAVLVVLLVIVLPFIFLTVQDNKTKTKHYQSINSVLDVCKKKEKFETCLILANEIADDDSLVKIYLEYKN